MAFSIKSLREGRVIAGTDDRDVLIGGRGDDEIVGGGGDDRLFGRNGDDVLDGGAGDDRLFGGAGDDQIIGGDGHDQIFAGRGDNVIDAGAGDDRIFGGAGDDRIDAGDGHDQIFAGRGDNVIDAGAGDDRIFGGAGDDRIDAGDGHDQIFAGRGDNVIDAGAGDDRIFGGSGDDVITGGAGQDEIRTGRGEDTVRYAGDPFGGQSVAAPGGQVVNKPDDLKDWSVRDDGFRLNARDFGIVGALSFANARADHLPDAGENVIVLQDAVDASGDGLNARSAAQLIAGNIDTAGAGVFVYFNGGLQINRLVFSSDLSDPDADLSVLANIESLRGQRAIDALPTFSAENFEFEDQLLVGDDADNLLVGGDFRDFIDGAGGDDVLAGLGDSDTLTGGAGRDQFAFGGDDPFGGGDRVAGDGVRQIIGGEDFITDFETQAGDEAAIDRFLLSATTFGVGQLRFAAVDGSGVDGSDPDALAALGAAIGDANMIVLLNADNDGDPSTPFLAGTAHNQIAAALQAADEAGPRPGFFIYFNSNLELNRLVFSEDLTDATTDLKIVARLTDALGPDAIAELASFVEGNFALGDVALGDDGANRLTGTAVGEDVIDGAGGDDVIDGLGGSDDLIGGAGADTFLFSGDPFDGAPVDPADGNRQIIGREDFIADFEISDDDGQAVDRFQFEAEAFGVDELVFASIDGDADDAALGDDVNLVVLRNADNDGDPSTPFLAGAAANQIADLFEDGAQSRPGFFVYFNSNLEVNRLVYSTDLTDPAADLKIVARLTDATGQDAIDALDLFREENFDLLA